MQEAVAKLDFEYRKTVETSLRPEGLVPRWVKQVEHTRALAREPIEGFTHTDKLETHEWSFSRAP